MILPRACATEASNWPRSPCSLARSLSTSVTRVIGTKPFAHRPLIPSSSVLIKEISRSFKSICAVSPPISSCNCCMRSRSCAFWPSRVVSPHLEQLALTCEKLCDLGIVLPIKEILRKIGSVVAVLFGFKARATRRKLVDILGDNIEIGLRLRRVETDQHVAGFHTVAVFHVELTDDAAGRVVNRLHVGIDNQRTRRDHRARQPGGCRPSADTEDEHRHRSDTPD